MKTLKPLTTRDRACYEEMAAEIIADPASSFRGHDRSKASMGSFAQNRTGPIGNDRWAKMIKGVADLASWGPTYAQVAHTILSHGIPLYQEDFEAAAKMWEGAAIAIERGYDNVVEAYGPEPARRGKRPFTVGEAISVEIALKAADPTNFSGAGMGWVKTRLLRENQDKADFHLHYRADRLLQG